MKRSEGTPELCACPSVSSCGDDAEFQAAMRALAHEAPLLDSPEARVRVAEWARTLHHVPDRAVAAETLQYLRLMVRHGVLHGPFLHPPPPPERVAPLAEALCNELAALAGLPRAGPMRPLLSHRTPDGSAYLAAQELPGRGLFCYLAVSPGEFNNL